MRKHKEFRFQARYKGFLFQISFMFKKAVAFVARVILFDDMAVRDVSDGDVFSFDLPETDFIKIIGGGSGDYMDVGCFYNDPVTFEFVYIHFWDKRFWDDCYSEDIQRYIQTL